MTHASPLRTPAPVNPVARGSRDSVRRVLLVTLVLNLLVAGGKIIVGLTTGALAITADGFHSLMDGASNAVGLVANRIAAQPPDDDHPYGHRRFETLAALVIGGLLVLTAWEIAGAALDRLKDEAAPVLSPLAFAVMLSTLVVNTAVNRYQVRAGRRLRSELLLADAANTGADVFVTLSVLLSMALVTATGAAWVDAVAALAVVLLIGRAAWRILGQTSAVLVDAAPYAPDHLTGLLHPETASRAMRVLRARSRGPLDAAQIDIDVEVPPETTTAQTADLSARIRACLCESLDGVAEIEVHFVPGESASVPQHTS